MSKHDKHENGAKRDEQAEHDEAVLRANGFVAIRAELSAATAAVMQVPLEAIDAAIRYLEQARSKGNIETHGISGDVVDQMDAELGAWQVIRTARVGLAEVSDRVQARAELRR